MLDRTGALIGEQYSSCYREGVLTVVVFEISLSHVKIFHHRPNAHNHHQVLSHAVRRLCVGSESELRRPRFVAVTTYRCRVRFRRPSTIYKLKDGQLRGYRLSNYKKYKRCLDRVEDITFLDFLLHFNYFTYKR